MSIVFLDIDGVLNDPGCYTESHPALIRPRCAENFNRVIYSTGAKVVLSSSWRYMVHSGSMTVKGFENLLRTHGVRCELYGVTRKDEAVESDERGIQIDAWLAANPAVKSFVVLDDMPLGLFSTPERFLRTDGNTGLTSEDADLAIEILCGRAVAKPRAFDYSVQW